MNRSPDLLDASAGAWALTEAHLEGRDDVRAVLLDGPDITYWRSAADHLAEQLAYRARRQFGDHAGAVVAGARRIVLAAAAGGGTPGGST